MVFFSDIAADDVGQERRNSCAIQRLCCDRLRLAQNLLFLPPAHHAGQKRRANTQHAGGLR